MPNDLPREIDGGRYKLLEMVGRGGYGGVYRGIQTSIDRTVAIKLVHPHLEDRGDVVERFRREARLTSRLRHPNAVQVIDFGESDGSLFLVMEFVQGQTLKHFARSRGSLSHEDILRITRGIAGALGAAHELGLVHRDLKPSNVLISDEGEPVVIDFGLVKVFSGEDGDAGVTRSDIMIGTPSYLSPEAVVGQALDGRSDLYTLGILLYEMLTNRRPFRGATPLEVATARLHEAPDPLPDSVPSPLREACEQLLALNPDERPSTAAALLKILEQPLALPAEPEPAPVSMEATRAPRRGPALLAHQQVLRASAPGDAPTHAVARSGAAQPPTEPTTHPLEPPTGSSTLVTGAGRSWARLGLPLLALALLLGGTLLLLKPWSVRTLNTPGVPEHLEHVALAEAPAELAEEVAPELSATALEEEEPPAQAAEVVPAPTEEPAQAPAELLEEALAEASVEAAGEEPEEVAAERVPTPSPRATRTVPPASTPPPVVASRPTQAPAAAPPPARDPPPTRAPAPTAQAAASAAAEDERKARLTVNIDPWGEVHVNGRLIGEAPIVGLELPAGTHQVVTNYLGQRQSERVTIGPGDHRTITHRFLDGEP